MSWSLDATAPGDMRLEEQAAAKILERVLGARLFPRDRPGVLSGSYDYDGELPDGRRFALEVTSPSGQVVERSHATLAITQQLEQIHMHGLQRYWVLEVDHEVSVKTIHRHLRSGGAQALLEFERANIKYFDKQEFTKVDRRRYPGIAGLLDRGVRRGDSFTQAPPGIEVVPASVGGQIARDSLNALVEREAERKRRQLQGAPHAERDLFIWVEHHTWQAWLTLTGVPPTGRPILPPEITTVWVAIYHGLAVLPAVVWRVTRNGWQVMPVP
jgi:hypothetical protein